MYKHILLPTDGSKLSEKAVKQCIRLAKSLGAKITAVNVTPEYQMVMDEGFVMPNAAMLKKRFEEETGKRSKQLLGEVKTEALAAGVDCDGVSITSGVPYEAIIKHAKRRNAT